jgi:hypothetical protein
MTQTQRNSSGSPSGGHESKAQATREQASNVGQNAAQAGGEVAQAAGQQGKEVAAETNRQAHNLLDQASSQLKEQADAQQKRAAEGLRALGDELQSMSSRSEEQGPATDLVRRASGTVHQAADWLEQREPGAVVNEVRDFARRHPGTFLAGAALAGVLAGRLTRNLAGTGGTASDGGGGGPDRTPQPDTAPSTTPPAAPEPTGQPARTAPAGETVHGSGSTPSGATRGEVKP